MQSTESNMLVLPKQLIENLQSIVNDRNRPKEKEALLKALADQVLAYYLTKPITIGSTTTFFSPTTQGFTLKGNTLEVFAFNLPSRNYFACADNPTAFYVGLPKKSTKLF